MAKTAAWRKAAVHWSLFSVNGFT